MDSAEPNGLLVAARINDEGCADVTIAAYQLEGPYNFGRFLADIARHAALAYSTTWSLDENIALEEICEGLSGQLRDQNSKIIKVQDGSLDS
jgi:hypothetical protein